MRIEECSARFSKFCECFKILVKDYVHRICDFMYRLNMYVGMFYGLYVYWLNTRVKIIFHIYPRALFQKQSHIFGEVFKLILCHSFLEQQMLNLSHFSLKSAKMFIRSII